MLFSRIFRIFCEHLEKLFESLLKAIYISPKAVAIVESPKWSENERISLRNCATNQDTKVFPKRKHLLKNNEAYVLLKSLYFTILFYFIVLLITVILIMEQLIIHLRYLLIILKGERL